MNQNIFYDRNNKLVHLRDDNEGWSSFQYYPTYYQLDPKGKFYTLDGQKCSPTNKYDKDHLEIDIDIHTRVLIDLYKDSDEPPKFHNTVFFDIEIKMGGQLTKEYVLDAPMEVTAIALYDQPLQKYFVLVLDEKGTLKDVSEEGKEVLVFRHEEDLLRKFLDIWQECDPTIAVGYNSDYFDIPYLYSRMKRVLGEPTARRISPLGIVLERPDDEFQPVTIGGITSFDYMRLHKRYVMKQEDSYSLNNIGKKYAGLGKIEYNGSLDRLMEEDIQKYIDYNINDVEILLRLDEKLQYVNLSTMICHIGHVSYSDIYQSSKINEGAILTYLKRKDIVSPNKPTTINPLLKGIEQEKTAGGFLKEPIPGLYNWIYDLDLTSLYPSIMRTLNMGYDTLICRMLLDDKKDCWWSLKELKELPADEKVMIENKDGKITSVPAGKFVDLIEKSECYVAANGVIYDSKRTSIIYEVLTDWFNKRVQYKELMKEANKAGDQEKYEFYKRYQLAVKVMLNSIYGCTALNSFRYGDGKRVIAGSITLTGQRIIQESIKYVNEEMNKEIGTESDYIVASDTDSMFVQALPIINHRNPEIDNNNDEAIIGKVQEIAKEFQSKVNNYYDILAKESFNSPLKHYLEMKMETVVKAAYWSKKRRYAQYIVNEEGVSVNKLDFKGLELMKSNFPKKFKAFGTNLIKEIMFGKKKAEVDKLVLDFKDEITTGPAVDVGKPTGVDGINKWTQKKASAGEMFSSFKLGAPAHVKAAVRYNDLLRFYKLDKKYDGIRDFDKIMWVNLRTNPYKLESMAITGYNDPPQIIEFVERYTDKEEVFNSIFLNKLESLYSDLGWSFPSLNKFTQKFFKF